MFAKSWRKLLASRLAPTRPGPAVRVVRRCRPRLELLETRCLLSAGINEFALPTASGEPNGITAGPDGNLWVTEQGGDKIGRIGSSGAVTEFAVPTAGGEPYGITAGPDGNLWFTELVGNKIGRITPAGTITEFTVPTAGSDPLGITTGPDGNLWFTEVYGGKIGRITPAGVFTEFTSGITAGSGPERIAAGADGNLWFTEVNGNNIGRITPAGVITEFAVPTAGSQPVDITAGVDGNLWFTEYSGNKIGRITTAGTISQYTVPTANSTPEEITAGADGNLWFTQSSADMIGRITPSGTVTEFAVPTTGSYPDGIAAGPDGNLWFTEFDSDKIGRLTVPTEFAVRTANSGPVGITAGPDGNLWFTEANGNKIGRISPSGAVTEFTVPTANGTPDGIAAGPDGNLWFTETNGNKVGRITPAGTITEFTVPTADSEPAGITAGPDDNLWFTENSGYSQIGRITPSGTITEFPVPTTPSFLNGITASPDGNLWFTENSGYSQIGCITLSGTITEFPVPTTPSYSYGITTGPDGNLWFTEEGGNKIGRITPSGTVTEFTVPTADSEPYGITAGPDGNLWFTELASNKIGRITPSGTITEFTVPTAGSYPEGITAGPDGNLWFTEDNGNQIGRIPLLSASAAPASIASGQTFAGAIASVIPFDSLTTASDLQALINWGDGTVSNGVLAGSGQAGFSISGTHTYAQNGTYTATVTISYVNAPTNLPLTPDTVTVNPKVAVTPAATTTMLASDFSPSSAGQPLAYVATVTTVVPSPATVTGVVQFWDASSGFLGAAPLSGGVATLTPPTLTAGTHTVYAVFQSNASFTTSTSANLTQQVNPGPATHFRVANATGTASAGSAVNFTVTALDAYNNTATGYSGTAHFTSSDGQATFGTNNVTLTNGLGTFSVTLKTAGSQTLTATDTTTSTLLGTSAAVTVSPIAATHFAVSGPLGITAGTLFGVTVTALDPYNNTATSYAGTVQFSSTAASATLPPNATLTQGVGTFGVILFTAGNQSVTATDTVTHSTTGTSGIIVVNITADPTLTVTPLSLVVAGTPFAFTVTAHDEFNNVATHYSGTVHFSSSDPHAVLPANTTLTNGTGTFSATFQTTDNPTVIATDTSDDTITGSTPVSVSAAAPFQLAFATAPSNTAAGATITPAVSVRIEDQYGNLVSDDNSDQVSLSIASGPGSFASGSTTTVTASAGIATFSNLRLNTAGTYTLSVTATGGLRGAASSAFNVTPTVPALTLNLSNQSVPEFRSVGTVVGTLSSTESGNGHTFSFTLVPGTGSTNNTSFTLQGNQLLTADTFDFAAQSSYSVRIRATDDTGQFVEQTYTITITDDPALSRVGRVLTVTGTAGQDVFTFVANAVRDSMNLDGKALAIDTASITTIHYLTGGGPDVVNVYGLGGDSATLTPTTFRLVGANAAYTVDASNCNDVNVFSSGANSIATFTLATADTFVGRYDYSEEADPQCYLFAVGFAQTTGNAVAGSGSQAWMEVPTTGSNTLTGTPTSSTIQGASYRSTANNFTQVAVFAPNDTTTLNQAQATLSTTNNVGDLLGGVPTYSFVQGMVSGNAYAIYAVYFSQVQVTGSANAVAYLGTSSASSDLYIGTATYSEVKGGGYDVVAAGFGRVQVWAGGTGQTAYLQQYSARDPYTSYPGGFIVEAKGTGYDNFAIDFTYVGQSALHP